jgi:hypothetical protein
MTRARDVATFGGRTPVAGGGSSKPYAVMNPSYQTYVTVNLTCTGRPVVVNYSITYYDGSSGANRTVGVRAALDGTTIGVDNDFLSSPFGLAAFTSAHSFIVTPTAGSRSFTLQARAATASASIIQAVELVVYEL